MYCNVFLKIRFTVSQVGHGNRETIFKIVTDLSLKDSLEILEKQFKDFFLDQYDVTRATYRTELVDLTHISEKLPSTDSLKNFGIIVLGENFGETFGEHVR